LLQRRILFGLFWIDLPNLPILYHFMTLGCRETSTVICQRNSSTTWHAKGHSV